MKAGQVLKDVDECTQGLKNDTCDQIRTNIIRLSQKIGVLESKIKGAGNTLQKIDDSQEKLISTCQDTSEKISQTYNKSEEIKEKNKVQE